MPPELIIFDLEDTLVPYTLDVLYAPVLAWLQEYHVGDQKLAIATNAGNVGLLYWQQTYHLKPHGNLPTQDQTKKRLGRIVRQFPEPLRAGLQIYVCYAYQAQNGKWSPTPPDKGVNDAWDHSWRKPEPGMLLRAMHDAGVAPEDTLMVGNAEEDQLAAQAAGCQFRWAKDFFAEVE